MSSILDTPLTYLVGVGPKRAESLARSLELYTYRDLLHYLPYKYIDRSRFYTIRELRPDMPYVQLRGSIRSWKYVGEGRKKRLVGMFYDASGCIELIWFRSHSAIERNYSIGREYIVFGKPTLFNGAYSIVHPEVDDESKIDMLSGGLVPLYSSMDRIKASGITNRVMRQLQYNLLEQVGSSLHETLPENLIRSVGLMSYAKALTYIHFPDNLEHLEAARQRLKFEELLLVQLKLQSLGLERKTSYQGHVFAHVGTLFNDLYSKYLPFDLTDAQKRVLREIRADLLSGHQMNRLVQGDVGSGKTLVALFAMLLALDNGYQACLMAPTEILARQHQESLRQMLEPLGVEVGLLVGSSRKSERQKLLPALESGEMRIVVGTHALLEEPVQFARLGLAVIDEQHRFGVEQRSRLWSKSLQAILPHILIMSATPIPRTLAMTLYGDLDISLIDELPPGRKPIETKHFYEDSRAEVYRFIREQVSLGRQIYIVYPMIEEQPKLELKNLEDGFAHYREIFPNLRLSMVHGKMKPKEKERYMELFASGEADILLATTVIEVGVNVPNASVMIIENANRFGLSQLHQLRGRVGRGAEQSYCLLLTEGNLGQDARRRMEIMVETNDGFLIAEEDMRLRGFGDLEGVRQSGQFLTLRVANLSKDSALVQYTRSLVERILAEDPKMEQADNQILRKRMDEMYGTLINWGMIS